MTVALAIARRSEVPTDLGAVVQHIGGGLATALIGSLDSVTVTAVPAPTIEEIETFLADRSEVPIEDLQPLDGGFWSSAYGYRIGATELVFRLSDSSEGFEMDRAAYRFSRPGLPIPEVLEIGTAFGRSFAISRRAHGSFLEDVDPADADRAAPMIDGLLDQLRSTDASPDSSVNWFADGSAGVGASGSGTWRGWLLDRLVDDPARTVSGWRSRLAEKAELDELFRTVEQRIRELVDRCPERRDLIHGDLLHQNVLISPDASTVTAVFSWKCSTLGDHLYDVAWLSFWEPWHPGIERVDAWSRAIARTISGDDLTDAALRHHCYELNIGAQHLAWCAWTNNPTELAEVASRTAQVLTRGPRPG